MRLRLFALGLAALTWTAPGLAQSGDRWEVSTDVPEYRGVRANAPIPPWQHILNEGGSDGAGLCVIASNTIDGLYQGVPEFDGGKTSRVWREAKSQPGGYEPRKLERLFRRIGFQTRWFQAYGEAGEIVPVIEHYTRLGVPVGTTMNTGRNYLWARIHHMVSTIHLDDKVACIVDNNHPGKYTWMSREEYIRRLIDGPAGWVVVLLKFKSAAKVGMYVLAAFVALWGLGFAVAAVLVGVWGARR